MQSTTQKYFGNNTTIMKLKFFYINTSIIKERLLTVCVKPKIKNEAYNLPEV